jgi:hypothetical protein
MNQRIPLSQNSVAFATEFCTAGSWPQCGTLTSSRLPMDLLGDWHGVIKDLSHERREFGENVVPTQF